MIEKDTIWKSFEPKRNNRFILTLPEKMGIPIYMVKSASRPSVRMNKGIAVWESMEFSFYDPIGPSTTQKLWDLYLAITDGDFKGIVHDEILNSIKEELKDIKDGFDVNLKLLDPTGVTVEEWELIGCKIERINFGTLDYSDNSVVEPRMTIKPTNVRFLY